MIKDHLAQADFIAKKAMRILPIYICIALLLACSTKTTEYKIRANDPEFIHRSVKAVTDRIVNDVFSPPVASRIYAYASIAAYEALIPEDPSYISLSGRLHGLEPAPQPVAGKEYCYNLAAAQALLKVGRAMIFTEADLQSAYDVIMNDFRTTGIPEDVFARSVEYGTQVGDHILAWAAKDNYKQSRSFPKYTLKTGDAYWHPTPPAYMDAIEPHWNRIRTFILDSAAQFKPLPPTTFSTDKKSQFYAEAKEVYDIGKSLTEEQKNIAMFWDCNPFVMNVNGHVVFATKKISPGGHWMNITNTVCKKTHASSIQTADAYAVVSIALADGFISCWDEKYRSDLIRPESFIKKHIDDTWTPLLQTPPFPEYTSGHSVISTSAATVLTRMFGENFSFTDSTEVEFGLPPRNFASFMDACNEAAISRMYGGIHYRPAVEQGQKQGNAVGQFVLSKLKP